MGRTVSLRTKEDLLSVLERLINAIILAGEFVSRSGTVVNAVNAAAKIIENTELVALQKQVENLERLSKIGGKYDDIDFTAFEEIGKATGADRATAED